MSIGARVKRLREARNMSQVELAKACGCLQGNLSILENGSVKMPRYLVELARALEVSPEWLKTGEGDPHPTSFAEFRNYRYLDIGLRLRNTRKALDLSVRDICKYINVSIETWEEWESGKTEPDVQSMIEWSRWHGITLDWIYRGVGFGLPSLLVDRLSSLNRDS